MKKKKTKCVLLDFRGTTRGWIQYNVEDSTDIHLQRCVVVGRGHTAKREVEYYVLVVRPTYLKEEYERIGVGMVQAEYISREGLNVRIV